jgi:hypothetical protein
MTLAAVALSAVSFGRGALAGGGPLLNGAFDANAGHWRLATGSTLNELRWAEGGDAGGDPGSGSLYLAIGEGPFDPGQSFVEAAVQCVPVNGSSQYNGGALARVPTGNQAAISTADLSFYWYSNPNCAGDSIANMPAGEVGIMNEWQQLTLMQQSPPGARSLMFRLELDGERDVSPDRSYAYFDDARLLGELGTLPGDPNCDRDINSIDSLLILQIDSGLIQALPCLVNGDANEDGIVNAIDATLALQFGAGLVDRLPVG